MSKDIKIEKERIIEAAQQCPDAKRILKTIFPDVFESTEVKTGIYKTTHCGDLNYIIVLHSPQTTGEPRDKYLYMYLDWENNNPQENNETTIRHYIEREKWVYICSLDGLYRRLLNESTK